MIRRVRTKRGLTLVELLVVVGVASVIAAVMLPGIKSVLTDRKSSQAAIMVRNYIEAARTRAIGRNRSVAVVFERLSPGRASHRMECSFRRRHCQDLHVTTQLQIPTLFLTTHAFV